MSTVKLSTLAANPDRLFEIKDDKDATNLLFELRLIDKFSKSIPGVAEPIEAVTGECKTHYILALLFTGRAKPEDNGYLVYCLPKNQCSAKKAGQFVSDVLRSQGTAIVVKPFSDTSSDN